MKRITFILFWLILLAGWTVGTFGQERPGGVSSNSVYSIALVAANSVGGPTNGVTAATAASIAATNVSQGYALGATNLFGSIHLRKSDGRVIYYTTITNALTDAASGDTVELGPGTFLMTNRFTTAPTNFTLRGAGKATVIANGYTNSAGASLPLFALRDNMVIENLSCAALYPTRYQAFVGARYDYGDVAFTNAFVRNISGEHNVDWFMLHHTNNTYATIQNCNIYAKWDSILIYSPNAGANYCYLTVENSTFINTGPNQVNPAEGARGTALAAGYRMNAYNSTFIASGTNAIGVAPNDSLSYANFYNCVVKGIGQGAQDVYNPLSNPISFFGIAPGFDNCIGSSGVLGTAPFDAYSFGNFTLGATNIVAPKNSELTITSGDEFSPATTTIGVTGDWAFPNSIRIGGSGAPTITSGAGAPASSEPNGSLYLRTDGSTATTLYVRISGAWVGK